MNDLVKDGRKAIDRMPGRETVESALKRGMRDFPSQLNLPARDDVEKIGKRLESLHHSVDALQEQLAA
jgi:polyhydroxyalkanoate synthesis regulator phasin